MEDWKPAFVCAAKLLSFSTSFLKSEGSNLLDDPPLPCKEGSDILSLELKILDLLPTQCHVQSHHNTLKSIMSTLAHPGSENFISNLPPSFVNTTL